VSQAPERAFDPLELTREASLNGTLLADLPGADPAWVGRTPFHLTSLPSLQERASAGGLGTSQAESGVAHIVDALASADTARAARAAEVVGVLGRGLGHLIATLKAAPPAAAYNPARPTSTWVAPSAWRAAYLNHWAQVDRIWLGGGLTAALGAFFLDHARAEVERLGVRDCAIDVAPYADLLALIGTARSRLEPPPVGVVLDLGGSVVKRAVALARGGALARLAVLAARAAPPHDAVQDAAGVAGFVVGAIADTYMEAKRTWGEVDAHVTVSLASYVVDGRPVSAHGTYGSLQLLERRQLEADLQLRTGAPIRLAFVHDGTAAARGLAQPGHAGLIVLGTFLAAGFPPAANRLAPLAEDFCIQRASGQG
jgi:hypothetical protein